MNTGGANALNTCIHAFRYTKELKPTAQKLRREMTPEEWHLWYDCLKKYPVQFRRQKQIGIYIVDFYCAKAKLVIELDGAGHYTQEGLTWDRARTTYMEELGLKVLRFENVRIREAFMDVCKEIDDIVKERTEQKGA